MSEGFIGEIRLFGFSFAPRGWANCNGQSMNIQQNTALYSLIGTTYGGDGKTTFNLPNLQGRVPINYGQGPGLTNRNIGLATGTEVETLDINHMPAHNHSLRGSSDGASSASPLSNVPATDNNQNVYLPTPASQTAMNLSSIVMAGGGQPHTNMMPYLAVNFCIALMGYFPVRP